MEQRTTIGGKIGARKREAGHGVKEQVRLRPAEVWTRLAAVPLLLASAWSHTLLGWAASLALMAAVVALALGLPLLQPAVERPVGWAGRVCLAERLWFSRGRKHLAIADAPLPRFLFGFSTATLVGAVWAATLNLLGATLFLAAASLTAKLAFQDLLAESLRH